MQVIKFLGCTSLVLAVINVQAQQNDPLNLKSCAMMCHMPDISETKVWDNKLDAPHFLDLNASVLMEHFKSTLNTTSPQTDAA